MCFNIRMEVVANPQNCRMSAPNYLPGVISAPDKLYKPSVMSSTEINSKILGLNRDVYSKEKKKSGHDNLKTPTSVLCVFGAIFLTTAFCLAKKFIKHK